MVPKVQGEHRHRANSIPHWPGETSPPTPPGPRCPWCSRASNRRAVPTVAAPNPGCSHPQQTESRQNASKLHKQTSSPPPLRAHLFIHVYRCFLKRTYREGRREKPSVTASSRKKKKRQNKTKQNRGVGENQSWAGKAFLGAALGIQIR